MFDAFRVIIILFALALAIKMSIPEPMSTYAPVAWCHDGRHPQFSAVCSKRQDRFWHA